MIPIENLPDDSDLTVLEYVQNWLRDQLKTQKTQPIAAMTISGKETAGNARAIFWVGLALLSFGQFFLGIDKQGLPVGGLVMILVGVVCVWLGMPDETLSVEPRPNRESDGLRLKVKPIWLAATLVMSVLCFLLFTENHFGWLQTLSWLTTIACAVYTFWPTGKNDSKGVQASWKNWQSWRGDWVFIAFVFAVAITGLIFRLKDLDQLPPEVISAQVETFYSVSEIRQGGNFILFSRNAVPEPLNYYWAYLINLFSGKNLSLSGIRLANSLAGLIGMAFVYALGKAMASRWVGLAAAGLAGSSCWLVLQERAAIGGGLVFPLMAAAIFGLIKGLDDQDGRYYLLSAAAAGFGLMSSKIFLIFPLAVLIAVIAWQRHHKQQGARRMVGLLGAGLMVSLAAAIPLIRAVSLEPASYFAPILARIGETEAAYAGNPILIFFGNLAKAVGLVNWTNQGSWVDSIANRGAVDGLTAVFFLFGAVTLTRQYKHEKDWKKLTLLLLYPILLLPSALALAFPIENPSMTRAVGAAVPVIIIAAFGIAELIRCLTRVIRLNTLAVRVFAVGLLFAAIATSNYSLVFKDYANRYKNSAWNASEIAQVIQRFFSSGREGISYLISYPYWVDSRAVSISMRRQEYNLSLAGTQIESTSNVTSPKLFIVNPMDKDSIAELQRVYPEGVISTYQSVNPDKNFIIYIVGQ